MDIVSIITNQRSQGARQWNLCFLLSGRQRYIKLLFPSLSSSVEVLGDLELLLCRHSTYTDEHTSIWYGVPHRVMIDLRDIPRLISHE